MDSKQKQSVLYRFSGYQLPKVWLDEPGFPSYYMPPYLHPYFRNQPQFWQKDFFLASEAVSGPASARAASLLSLKTMGSTYGSGGSLPSTEKKSKGAVSTIDSIKAENQSAKKSKKKLFSLVKI